MMRAVLLSTLVVASGCVAPIIVPPAKATLSAGHAIGQVTERPAARPVRGATVGQARVGVHPLSLVEPLLDRPVDVGVGLVWEAVDLSSISGQYVSLAANTYTSRIGERGVVRFALTAHGDRLTLGNEVGWGYGVETSVEVAHYTRGAISDAGSAGAYGIGSVGEIGIGLTLGADYRRVGPLDYALYRVGLTLRVPLAAGVAVLVPPGSVLRAAPRLH